MSKCPSVEKKIQKEKSPIQIQKKRKEVIINGLSVLESGSEDDERSIATGASIQDDNGQPKQEEQKKDGRIEEENAAQNQQHALEQDLKKIVELNDSFFNSVCSWDLKTCVFKTGLPSFSNHARQTILGPYTALPFRAQIGCCFVEYYPVKNNQQKESPIVCYLNALIMLIKQQHGLGKTFNTWNELIPFARNIQQQHFSLKNNDKEKMINLIKQNGRVRITFMRSYNQLYGVKSLKCSYNSVTFFFNANYVSCSYQYEFIQYDAQMNPSTQKRSLQHKDLDNPKGINSAGLLQQYMKNYPALDDSIRPFISTENERKEVDALLLMCICNSHSVMSFKLPSKRN